MKNPASPCNIIINLISITKSTIIGRRKILSANSTLFNWIDQGVSSIMNTAKRQKFAREAWEAMETASAEMMDLSFMKPLTVTPLIPREE